MDQTPDRSILKSNMASNSEFNQPPLELSVVMPCLNEADTLGICLEKAFSAIARLQIGAEVIVVDNGSTDASVEIAEEAGATVVHVVEKGYGSALMGGILAATGAFVIMGDADDSYDFTEIPKFVEKLRMGYDLVQGCRLPAGGGQIVPGAMPFSHRWIGNPLFSQLVKLWFKAPINDVYCGLRGFRRSFWYELDQQCTGMEFATEMIIKSSLRKARISEVPITLHKDGRQSHAPHLKTIQDGWRTLRLFLLFTPKWLFMFPGLVLLAVGASGYVLVYLVKHVALINFDVHTLLVASLFLLCGCQAVLFAVFASTFAGNEGLIPEEHLNKLVHKHANLERGLAVSAIVLILGIILLVTATTKWVLAGFGEMPYSETMKIVIPGVTMVAIGFQTILSGFVISLLGMRSKHRPR